MTKIKVLNLYAGLGGNRLLWKNVDVTAIEIKQTIADIYQSIFKKDTVIVGCAHEFLLKDFKKFDFIWSSPPCQKHSKLNALAGNESTNRIIYYPDLQLYEEIILLQQYAKCGWVVENVIPYYLPLIKPRMSDGKHLFWSNYKLPEIKLQPFPTGKNGSSYDTKEAMYHMLKWLGMPLKVADLNGHGMRPIQLVRNCVHPKIGLKIYNSII